MGNCSCFGLDPLHRSRTSLLPLGLRKMCLTRSTEVCAQWHLAGKETRSPEASCIQISATPAESRDGPTSWPLQLLLVSQAVGNLFGEAPSVRLSLDYKLRWTSVSSSFILTFLRNVRMEFFKKYVTCMHCLLYRTAELVALR